MTVTTLVMLGAWAVIFALAYRSGGAGLAFAAVLGRYEFPQRGDEALFTAAPVLIAFTLVGFIASRKRQSVAVAPQMILTVIALSAVGAASTVVRGTLTEVGFERLIMLATYVLPLAVLAAALSDDQLTQFRIWFVRTALGLASIALVVGSVDDTGRAAALGGGPIPLAQLCMFGLLMVAMFDDDYVPAVLGERWRLAVRAVFGLLFIFVGIQTASRFPILAVGLSAAMLAITWMARERHAAGILRHHMRSTVVALVLLVPLGYVVRDAIGEDVTSRFQLLSADFGSEVQRSRGDLFTYSWGEAIGSLPFGYGPGNFETYYFKGSATPIIYPHNLFLEVLGDYGLVGFAILLVALGKLFLSDENHYCDPRYLMLGFYALSIALSSGDLVHNRYLFLFGTVVIMSRRRSLAERIKAQPAQSVAASVPIVLPPDPPPSLATG